MRFLILIFLFGIVNAQRNYDVDLNNGIVEFTDISNSVIRYSYTASEISYREVGSNNFDICDNANCNGFDINVINNFSSRAYLIDSLNYWQSISGGGGSDLWQTTNGFYEPKEVKPFRFESGSLTLLNDTAQGGGGMAFPYAGELGSDYGGFKGFNGIIDLSVMGQTQINFIGWIDFLSGATNGITIQDTSSITIQNHNVGMNFYESDIEMATYNEATNDQAIFNLSNTASINVELIGGIGGQLVQEMSATNGISIEYSPNVGSTITLKLNSNGLVLPNLSADPTGETGAMYFNTSMNKVRIYHGGTWHNNN